MPAFTSADLILLAFLGALLMLGVLVAVLLARQMVRQIGEATAAVEILREHPDLLRAVPHWGPWTDSVDMPNPLHRAASRFVN